MAYTFQDNPDGIVCSGVFQHVSCKYGRILRQDSAAHPPDYDFRDVFYLKLKIFQPPSIQLRKQL